ncbi:MAG: type II toxin-antitoxin system PemK/MazF family toxin [Anaerolineales bacterium]|nr:type II toxin-antitoxin system PemK/MazF family toxin [Anaerolineales bacterium]
MVINQGDVFWIDLGEPEGSEPGYERPFVVIQNNVFNVSKLNTVIVCAITSILHRGSAPGNVLLNEGEANLPKPSVVLISQIYTVDKSQLGEYIGTLPRKRIRQILDGLELITEPREVE